VGAHPCDAGVERLQTTDENYPEGDLHAGVLAYWHEPDSTLQFNLEGWRGQDPDEVARLIANASH
jgi:hypothetical protein